MLHLSKYILFVFFLSQIATFSAFAFKKVDQKEDSLLKNKNMAAPLDANTNTTPDPKWLNFKVNPQGYLFSVIGGSVDLRLSDHFAVGPSLNVLDTSNSRNDLTVYQYSVTSTIFLGGHCFENAWFLRGSVGYITIDYDRFQDGDAYHGVYKAVIMKATGGRSWHIWKGLNAGAGIGVSQAFGPENVNLKSDRFLTQDRLAPISQKIHGLLEVYIAWAI